MSQVREHHRKVRKEAKKKGKSILVYKVWNVTPYRSFILGLKKDPGIPNLYPFKDQLLREIKERKQRVHTAIIYILTSHCVQAEETKKRQKEDRRKEHMKRRSGLEGLKQDAEKRSKDFNKKVKHFCLRL